jgi:hypothetical protein
MNNLKLLYKDTSLKVVIEEDIIGFYLIVYKDPLSTISTEDYLLDNLEDALKEAKELFGISIEQWQHIN